MSDYAPGQDNADIPEVGWDSEMCLSIVQNNDRFISYCALHAGHKGGHTDTAYPPYISIPDELLDDLVVGLGLVEGSRQYHTAISAAQITMHYYGKKS